MRLLSVMVSDQPNVKTVKGLVNAMKLLTRLAGLMIVVVAFSATIAGAQEPTAGVVRISDQDTVGTQMKLQSHAVQKELGCETDPAGECDQCGH